MRSVSTIAAAIVSLCAALVGSLLIGAAPIDVGSVIWSLAHPWSNAVDARIIWEVRLPRVVIGAFVGSTLGYCGAIMQTLIDNPLVDPYITGVSAGAGVAITLAIACGIAMPFVPALGFVAGLAAACIVIGLAIRSGRVDSRRLILAGVFVSAFLSAIVMIVLFRMQPGGAANAILSWLGGSLAGHGWTDFRWCVPYAIVGLGLSLFSLSGLNAMRLGEQRAATLGVHVARTQWITITSTALLTSSSVVLSGLIGFVGLLSPHLARRAVGFDIRKLAPMSALIGAEMVIGADAAARTWAQPGELPIGALISILGVPAFFYIFYRDGADVGAIARPAPSLRDLTRALQHFGRRSL